MSDTINHTPAPWRACSAKGGECQCFIVSAEDHPICTVENGEWGDTWPELDEHGQPFMQKMVYGSIDESTARANQRLIAAAPDLLTALRNFLTISECGNDSAYVEGVGYMDISAIRASARTAIAAVEGRTE